MHRHLPSDTPLPCAATPQTHPLRPGSQSLLQSLLGPVRARVPSQGMLGRRDSTQAAGGPSTPDTSTPQTSQPASPKRPQAGQQQQQQQQQGVADTFLQLPQHPADNAADSSSKGGVSAAGANNNPAAAAGGGAVDGGGGGGGVQAAGSGQQLQASGANLQTPNSATAAAAAGGGAATGSQQPLSSLMDVSSGEIAKLLRNPAAYSAGAINKLSSSVTSTVSSLLVGKDGQPG